MTKMFTVLLVALALLVTQTPSFAQTDECHLSGDIGHVTAYFQPLGGIMCLHVEDGFLEVFSINPGQRVETFMTTGSAMVHPSIGFGVANPTGGTIKFYVYDSLTGTTYEGAEVVAISAKIFAWSPDGKHMQVWVTSPSTTGQPTHQLWVASIQGDSLTYNIASGLFDRDPEFGFPSWSTDSIYMAYWFVNDSGDIELGIYQTVDPQYFSVTDEERIFSKFDLTIVQASTLAGGEVNDAFYMITTEAYNKEGDKVTWTHRLPLLNTNTNYNH